MLDFNALLKTLGRMGGFSVDLVSLPASLISNSLDTAKAQCTLLTCAVSCGSPNPVGSNLVTVSTCLNTTFGSTCTVRCAPGFTGTLSLTRQCQSTGAWSGTPQCAPATCTSTSVVGPTLASLNRQFARCAAQPTNGEACVAECREGFEGAPQEYHCELPTPSSSSVALVHRGSAATSCTPITCSLASLRNALGLATTATSSAAATGTGWANPTIPTTFTYGGNHTISGCPNGGTCSFVPSCASGFVAVGPVFATDLFRCIGLNEWSSGRRVCRPRSCGSPLANIPNSEADSCSTTFGSTCTVRCASG